MQKLKSLQETSASSHLNEELRLQAGPACQPQLLLAGPAQDSFPLSMIEEKLPALTLVASEEKGEFTPVKILTGVL